MAQLKAASPEVHADLQAKCQAMADSIGARDWGAFFAALIAFAEKILPFILPLLVPAPPADEGK